jgi:hypothetical protein
LRDSRGNVLGCFALDALVDLFRGILRHTFRSRWNHISFSFRFAQSDHGTGDRPVAPTSFSSFANLRELRVSLKKIEERSLTEFILSTVEGFEMTGLRLSCHFERSEKSSQVFSSSWAT